MHQGCDLITLSPSSTEISHYAPENKKHNCKCCFEVEELLKDGKSLSGKNQLPLEHKLIRKLFS